MVMKTREQEIALRRTVSIAADSSNQRAIDVVQERLQASQVLTLSDENDLGGDPYNSTGQHATLGAIKK